MVFSEEFSRMLQGFFKLSLLPTFYWIVNIHRQFHVVIEPIDCDFFTNYHKWSQSFRALSITAIHKKNNGQKMNSCSGVIIHERS